MAFNVGLNIVEVDGSATPAIAGAATSVAAFNVITRRGVPNRPARIHSFPEFEQRFGGHFSGGMGAYLVRGFFDNGGQTAYVNRVVATDATTGAAPAALTLDDGAALDTLTLEGGYRGTDDPGRWGDDLYVRVAARASATTRVRETAAASVQSAVLAPPLNMAAFPPLDVRVDGETTTTQLTFQASDFAAPATATLAEVRDAINRRTTKLIASISGGNRLVLTSSGQLAQLSKDFTRIQVMAAHATLGFAAMATATAGTPAARTTTGTTLAEVSNLLPGEALRVTDGANTALVKLMTVNPLTGAVTWAPAIAGIAAYDPLLLRVSKVEFDLELALGGGDPDHVVETWTGLSMEADLPNYAPTRLNDPLQGSRYVTATDALSASAVGADVPAATAGFVRFTPGRDGTPTANDFIGSQASKTGLYAFDPEDVQLLTCERTDPAIVAAALGYCQNRGDCTYIGAVPEGFVAAGQAVAYGQAFQARKVYGAVYGPWIVVQDPIGTSATPLKKIPPTGHVMGICARVETTRGIWKAPAGDEANLVGALDVEYRLSDAEHTDLVKNGSVNGIRPIPRSGIVVDASRTLSTDTRWLFLNVRLLFNYVKSSLKQGLRWVRQEPNRDTLWTAIKFGTVTPFLMRLWRQGAFGTGNPDQVFTVICDATNNPPSEVDLGNLYLEVYFYPSKPAETIVIKVGQRPSGASAAEA